MPVVERLSFPDEAARHAAFPVTRAGIFMAHAGVCPLPKAAAEAVQFASHRSSLDSQEYAGFPQELDEARAVAAKLLVSAKPEEIALVGPTALGLNLVASGIEWAPGDEVIYYPGDYPSNVYPWTDLARKGVKPVPVCPATTGHITPELVFAALTPRTKLVALASCHFLTGYRLDYKAIGTELKKRGILFCLDAIQSLGATEVDAAYVDFLSADSHKWLLGPLGAGIFYVRKEHFAKLRPALLGSWNVTSPQFIAQDEIAFPDHGRRYECGALFGLGILGMKASMEMLLALGIANVENRLLGLHDYAADLFRKAGFEVLSDAFPKASGGFNAKTGIVTIRKPGLDDAGHAALFRKLKEKKITASHRWDAQGQPHLRFSPHFYNTETEFDVVLEALAE
ncbi:MAG TPA: aminotransferase class V-fold PLP-dependent enzyme [Candidatus Methylacidiphilales bacterium]